MPYKGETYRASNYQEFNLILGFNLILIKFTIGAYMTNLGDIRVTIRGILGSNLI